MTRKTTYLATTLSTLLLLAGLGAGCGQTAVNIDSSQNTGTDVLTTDSPTPEPTPPDSPVANQSQSSLDAKLLTCPEGELPPYSVTIRDESGSPMENAKVEVRFNAIAAGRVSFCSGSRPDAVNADSSASFVRQTDADGNASFLIKAGGCFANDASAALQILVNDVEWVASLPFRSGDVDGIVSGAGLLDVSFSDVNIVGPLFALADNSNLCADLNVDGLVGIEDSTLFTEHIAFGHGCVF